MPNDVCSSCPLSSPKRSSLDDNLPTTTVIQSPRQIDQRQGGGLAAAWATIAEVSWLWRGRIDETDYRGRRPSSFTTRNGHFAVWRQTKSVWIAKTGSDHFRAFAVGRDPQYAILSRGGIESPLIVTRQPACKIVSTRRGRERSAYALVEVGLTVVCSSRPDE